ncbi:MAG: PQQ-binding-like beta-propeller repeat protein [Planctomycetota bacterium]
MPRIRLLFVPLVSLSLACSCFAEDYPQFRGANGDAVSSMTLPVTWSDVDGVQKNIRWKISMDGEGWSQPIVWADRLYLTAAVPADPASKARTRPESNNGGYGRDRYDLVRVNYQYQVICIDAGSGKEIWRKSVKEGKPPIPRHSTNTYATETPVTDGERIYAYFGMNGVYCLDMDGNLQWKKDLGVYEMRAGWGTSSSPTLLDSKLFIQVDNQEQSFLVALNKTSGEEVWRVPRNESSQYSSPFIWKNSLRNELIVGGMVYRSYDPATGELLWEMDMDKGRSSATPVAIGDRLFIGNEFRNRGGSDDGGGRLLSIIPGGSGDITPPDDAMSGKYVEWRMDESGIQMASPTYCDGNLYFFERRRGIVRCVDAKTGRLEYEKRVGNARAFWASPWSDNEHVFALDASGNTHVIAAGDEWKVVAVNELEQQAWGTPAIANGRIYLRTVDHLYCIAE